MNTGKPFNLVAGIGRPHAITGEPAEAYLHLRVQRRRKAAYVKAAQRSKATLAAWCLEHLDKGSGFTPSTK
jgi:hypothetical protein